MMSFEGRTADHDVEALILSRWSPRAFTGAAIPEGELMRILEAARWAPSSYNSQPWRIVWARRDTAAWAQLFGLLGESNRSWAQNAAALLIMASKSTMLPPGQAQEVPSYSHSFDAGSAWALMAVQALAMGWHTHGMVGFDKERAFAELGFPPGHRIEAAIAIGRRGDRSSLPEGLQAREAPNGRNPVDAFAFEGVFRGG